MMESSTEGELQSEVGMEARECLSRATRPLPCNSTSQRKVRSTVCFGPPSEGISPPSQFLGTLGDKARHPKHSRQDLTGPAPPRLLYP